MHTHYHFIHQHHNKAGNLNILFAVSTLRTAAFTFLSLFLPILLYQHFLYQGETNALIITMLFYLLLQITRLLTTPVMTRLAYAAGLKTCFVIGLITAVGSFTAIRSDLLITGFILLGIGIEFWWFAYHSFFIDKSKTNELGKQVGLITALGLFTGVAAPLVGGWLIEYAGTSAFFGFGVLLIGLACALALRISDHHQVHRVYWHDIAHWWKSRPRDGIAFIGFGGEALIYGTIWPIFGYIIYQDIMVIAVFSSGVMLISAILSIIAGKKLDKGSKESMEKLGSWSISANWIGKATIQNPLAFSIFDLFHKLMVGFRDMPLTVIAYEHAHYGNQESYVVYRATMVRIGMILAILGFIITTYLGFSIWFTFILAAFFAILPSIIRR